MSDKIEEGSGNIFKDLEFENPKEELTKAELTRQIHNIIKQQGLTQNVAGKILDLTQPDVSRLMRGQYTGFSSDRLFRFLNALDCDVEIIIKPKNSSEQASIRIFTEPMDEAA